jgi:hypothetical protein
MASRRRRIWLGGGDCCRGRPDTCQNARLLPAHESDFHDERLIEATRRINEIFKQLGEPPPGRHLAFADTGFGFVLIWARGIDRPDDISEFVRYESPDEEIRQALGLHDESAVNDPPSISG